MTKIKTSLLKLIGRIKEYMPAILLGLSGLLIPSGVALFIMALENLASPVGKFGFEVAIVLFIFGIISLVCALIAQSQQDREHDSINQKLILTLDAIYFELLKRR